MPHLSLNKQQSLTAEKRQFFSIRRLKVGTASVAIASALFFLGVGNVRAESPLVSEAQVSAQVSQVSGETSTPSAVVTKETSSPLAASESSSLQENPSNTGASIRSVSDQPSQNQAVTTETEPRSVTEVPIAEGDIRLHFQEVTDANVETSGLWTWGAVDKPSTGTWPSAASPFDTSKEDGYSHYIDVTKASQGGDIGYVLLNNGQKVGGEGDRKITLIDSTMNEAWVDKSFNTYTYQPLADANIVRINYKRADNNYDGWGLWAWGDVASASQKWPNDAMDFVNEGKYGRYIDLPLSKALDSSIGFLLVNKKDPTLAGNKSIDYKFANRNLHSQVFLKSGDGELYTNSYYVKSQVEQDFSKAIPGTKGIFLEAKSLRAFNYNETGLIDLAVTNPNNAKISRIEMDTAQLGGGKILISPELNRVTITATANTAVGTYQLPVRLYDADNGYYDAKVSVSITARQKKTGEKDWDEQVIYFMMTDRFYNGDTSNDNPYNQPYSSAVNKAGTYKGGDFKGVTAKLDYLKSLGVTSVWLTPIVENVPQNVSTEAGKDYYAYHGYWADNFEKLNPHLGTLADFHQLIDQAAERGIAIIVDVVLNHAGYGAESKFPGMLRTGSEIKAGDDQRDALAGLPGFKTEDDTVRKQLVAWQSQWLEKSKKQKVIVFTLFV